MVMVLYAGVGVAGFVFVGLWSHLFLEKFVGGSEELSNAFGGWSFAVSGSDPAVASRRMYGGNMHP